MAQVPGTLSGLPTDHARMRLELVFHLLFNERYSMLRYGTGKFKICCTYRVINFQDYAIQSHTNVRTVH